MAARKIVSDITKYFVILSSLFILDPANTLIASSLTYQRDYTYQASEADSKLSCRTIALEQVKRLLLEELGTYLKSNTEVKDFQVSKDQVIAMTAGIVGVAIINEKWDGQTYYISAKVSADPGQVAKAIKELQQDPEKIKEVETLKNQNDEIIKELKMLREELKASKEVKMTGENREYEAAVKKLNANDWYKEGTISAKAGKYRDAISYYDKAIDADLKFVNAYAARAWAYNRILDFQSASQDFSRALDLRSNSPNILLDRAAMYITGTNEFNKAQADIDQAIKLKPDNARAYQIRAIMYLNTNKLLTALDDCNKALELNPNFYDTYATRANVYREMKRYDDALKDYQKYIEINPNFADVYANRGLTYRNLKKYDEALRDLNKALELHPYFWRARHWRGLVYYDLKKYGEAIQEFSKTIELKNNYADAYYVSFCYKNIGKLDESLNDLKKAAQLGDVRAQKAINK
jgi:tetratricopeptide (TPR) repeat protein